MMKSELTASVLALLRPSLAQLSGSTVRKKLQREWESRDWEHHRIWEMSSNSCCQKMPAI